MNRREISCDIFLYSIENEYGYDVKNSEYLRVKSRWILVIFSNIDRDKVKPKGLIGRYAQGENNRGNRRTNCFRFFHEPRCVASRKRTFPLLVAQPAANVCSDRIARLYITQTGGPRFSCGGNINLSTNRDHVRLPELLLKLIYSNLVSSRIKFDPLQKYSIRFASINASYKFNFINNLIIVPWMRKKKKIFQNFPKNSFDHDCDILYALYDKFTYRLPCYWYK